MLSQLGISPVDLYLISEKTNSKKSSSTNWIFSLFWTEFLLPVLPAKINFKIDSCRLKIQFGKLDFSNLIFQNSSIDQQGERKVRLGLQRHRSIYICIYISIQRQHSLWTASTLLLYDLHQCTYLIWFEAHVPIGKSVNYLSIIHT